MVPLLRTVVLRNGVEMPRVGLGTHKARGEECEVAVKHALEAGYKHIDTASIYKNEGEIAGALSAGASSREDVFLTTKVSPYEQGYEKAREAVEQSLARLQTDYLDCVLIHWPGASRTPATSEKNREMREESWRALEELYNEGKCRSIGVSNFIVKHLQGLLERCQVKPMVNQVEMHPALQQRELRAWCATQGVEVVAYSPLGTGALLQDPVIVQMAAKHHRTPAQVLLRWALQIGVIVIPKSITKERIVSNLDVFDFELDEEDMKIIESLDTGHHFCWNADDIL